MDCTGEMAPLGYFVLRRGTILRLPRMLAEEYLYTLLRNIKISWGYPTFPGLMVDQLCSRESIADLLGILCLFGADGRPTLLGESIAESCLTLRGVKVSRSNSSAELTLVPWWTEQPDLLDNSYCPSFCRRRRPVRCLITAD